MKNALVLTLFLFSLAGCKSHLDGTNDSAYSKLCTLIGSMSIIQVHVESSTTLPANLGVVLNDSGTIADECRTGNGSENSIQVSADRSRADIVFVLDGSTEYDRYFQNAESAPISDAMNLKFFSQNTCSDSAVQLDEVPLVSVSWRPVHANGSDCGVTSYSGTSQVSF